MSNQKLLENFKVEELEQRYEMGRWVESVGVGYKDEKVDVLVTFKT